ncbi:MAG: glycosyltransferase family 2 protein [bacterium]|nr:glycosyltransferase family 2 protein [bacterium]
MIEPLEQQHPPKTVVVIPAFNEERFIGSVVLKARQFVETVIVVDDGSTDSTREIAQAAGAVLIAHDHNGGKGMALNTGFAKAREYAPDVVVTLDGDWQHMPEQIAQVAAPILGGQADIVVGSRYLDDTSDVPPARVIGHWGFTALTNLLSGVRLTDSQSGYRAFSPRAVQELSFSSRSFSVESEMQFLARDHQFKVVEVPIIIRYADKPKRSVVRHGFTVLDGLLHLVVQHRPLLFFSVPGLGSLLVGLLLGLQVIHSYNVSQTLAIGTGLLVVLFLLTGLFFIFTGIILWALRAFFHQPPPR